MIVQKQDKKPEIQHESLQLLQSLPLFTLFSQQFQAFS